MKWKKNTKLPMKYIHETSGGGVPPKDIRETLLLIHLSRDECIVCIEFSDPYLELAVFYRFAEKKET